MGYRYPNLVSGTRGTECYKETLDQQQDDSQPWDLHNASRTQENFLWPSGMHGLQLKPGTDYTLYFWADRTDNMSSADVWIIDVPGGYVPLWMAVDFQIPAGGGGYVSRTFQFSYEPKETTRYEIRFDNNGSTDGRDSVLRIRDVMLTEGTEPHAWAPAAGEVWP